MQRELSSGPRHCFHHAQLSLQPQSPARLHHSSQPAIRRQPVVVTAAKRQRLRVGAVLPLIPRIRRPQRFAFVTNPKDLDPDEVWWELF